MRIRPVAAAFLLLASPVCLRAQAPSPTAQGQPRPGAPSQQAATGRTPAAVETLGTGRITGRVLSVEGRPLRGAQVMASSTAARRSYFARSDAEGRYEVKNLPRAEFSVLASKPGYVRLHYGARPGGGAASKPVRVGAGETVEKIDFQLARACVITGRVLDEYGEPFGEAGVEPMKPMLVGGRRRLLGWQEVQTDDLGQFRLHGLEPGDYVVRARLRSAYNVLSDDRTAYPPTFYPGTTAPAEATRVPCRAGQETPGVQISLGRVSTAKLSGVVRDSEGKPTLATVILARTDDVLLGTSASAATRADGSFTLANVLAGAYRLMALSTGGRSPGDREMAVVDVSVGARDLAGVAVQLARGAVARGRVVADADAAFDFPLSRLRVATVTDPDNPLIGTATGAVTDEGNFELVGLLGTRSLQLFTVPDGWTVKTVRTKNGESDQPIAFQPGETVDGIEFVLTNRITRLSGTVTDDRNRPVRDYVVGLFPDDPAHWGPGGRSKLVRADESGRYEVKGLVPGRYLAVASIEINGDDWMDPEYLERLRTIATPVTLNEGQVKTLDLKLIVQ